MKNRLYRIFSDPIWVELAGFLGLAGLVATTALMACECAVIAWVVAFIVFGIIEYQSEAIARWFKKRVK